MNSNKTDIKTVVEDGSGINVAQATKTGFIFCPVKGIFDMSYPNSKLRRGRVQGNGQISPTLTCSPDMLIIVDSVEEKDGKKVPKLRHLTESECFRLMGLEENDIKTLVDSDLSKTKLYKLAGNSIVKDVLVEIFRTMFVEKNCETGQSNALF